MGNTWIYKLEPGDVFGLQCGEGFKPECPCHHGRGHKTTITRKEKYRGRWYFAVRYYDEYDGVAESSFLPVVYLKQYATKGY